MTTTTTTTNGDRPKGRSSVRGDSASLASPRRPMLTSLFFLVAAATATASSLTRLRNAVPSPSTGGGGGGGDDAPRRDPLAPIVEEEEGRRGRVEYRFDPPDGYDESDLKVVENAVANAMVVDFVRGWMDSSSSDPTAGLREPLSLRRSLATGDFRALNDLLSGVEIKLPPADFSKEILYVTTLNMWIKNLICKNIRVDDIQIGYNKMSDTKLTYTADILGLKIDCDLDYEWEYGISGDGSAQIKTEDNRASVTLSFTSPEGFDVKPPTETDVEDCVPVITVRDMDFDRDSVLGTILDWFEGFLRDTVQTEVQKVACDELKTVGTELLPDLLKKVDELIEPYLKPLSSERSDPMHAEKNLIVPEGMDLLNFQETEEDVGEWFDAAIREASAILGATTEEADGTTTPAINEYVRSALLDDDGAYVLDMSKLPFADGDDFVIFEAHDMLTETSMKVDEVRLTGLDSFTRFDPLNAPGKHTLYNLFSWEELCFEVVVTVDMKPSSHSESVIVKHNGKRQVETITIKACVHHVEVMLAFLLALDLNELKNVELGSVLHTDQILGCLLDVVHDVQVTALSVWVKDILTPELDNFISPGIDRVVTTSADVAFLLYEAVIKKAMPNFFQIYVRDALNSVLDEYRSEAENASCPKPSDSAPDEGAVSQAVDLRDFLLSPEAAKMAGATGLQPYGDVVSTLMDVLETELLADDDNGIPKINSVMIRPLTETQSGIEGSLFVNASLVDWESANLEEDAIWSAFAHGLRFSASDAWFRNLDTVVSPLELLKPVWTDPHALSNYINMGDEDNQIDRHFNASVKLLLVVDGHDDDDASPLAMKNELVASVSVPTAEMLAAFRLAIDERQFLEFPLRDIVNGYCWLSTLPPSELDDDGFPVDPDVSPSAALTNLVVSLGNMKLDASCASRESCSSGGLLILPDVIDSLEGARTIQDLQSRLLDFAVELLEGEMIQTQMNRWLIDAPKRCPHRPEYDETLVESGLGYDLLGFPDLSRDSLELAIFAGVVFVEVVGVVTAESHVSFDTEPTDPLSGQASLVVPEGTRLVDWTDLNATVGGWADLVIDEARDYVGSVREGDDDNATDYGINLLLRSSLLDENGILSVSLLDSDLRVREAGVEVSLREVRLFGLDEFDMFDVLDFVAPQTMLNRVGLKRLRAEVDVGVDLDPSDALTSARRKLSAEDDVETMTVSLELEDVDVSLALLLAIDVDKFGGLNLGSVLHFDYILPCLLSTFVDLNVPQFSVTVGKINEPTIVGFVSSDLDERIAATTKAIFGRYGSVMANATDNFFDVTVRGLLNDLIESYTTKTDLVEVCAEPLTSKSSFGSVDFRDMFWSEEKAARAGASGESPYGTLLRGFKEFLDAQFLVDDPVEGKPKINDAVVVPLTEAQSDSAGEVQFLEEPMGVTTEDATFIGVESAEFRASNARVQNLDSFVSPLKLLEPNADDPYSLLNSAAVAAVPDPLRGMLRTLLQVRGSSVLDMRNELDVGVSTDSAAVLALVQAKISEKRFLEFPLRDLLDVNCLLATVPAPALDDEGVRMSFVEPNLALEQLSMLLRSMELGMSCVSCTSSGFWELPEIMATLEDVGMTEELRTRLVDFAAEILRGEFVQTRIDRFLSDASKRCPHSPEYDEDFASAEFDGPSFPSLSRDSVEHAIFAGAVAMQVAAVVVAESHAVYNFTPTQDEVPPPDASAAPESVELLDLERLGETVGTWFESALEEVNGYLGRDVADAAGEEDLAINELLRDFLLDDDGAFSISLDDVGISEGDMNVTVAEIRVAGLDTFERFDVLEIVGPQTIHNHFRLDELRVEVDVAIDLGPESGSARALENILDETPNGDDVVTISVGVKNVTTTLGVLLAMDQDLLGGLQLGSMLRTENILTCLLSAAHAISLTELSVTVDGVDEPVIEGFISDELHDTISRATRAIFDKYESTMVNSTMNLFNVTARGVLNDILTSYLNEESSTLCPRLSAPISKDGIMDFRSLLLSEEESMELGGSGSSPYGDLLRMLKSYLDKEVLAIDETDGRAKLNDLLIGPLTEAQSNMTGTLVYPGDLFNQETKLDVGGLKATIELRASDVRIENLDSVGPPLELIQPVLNEPSVLDNKAVLGVQPKPLRGTLRLLIALQGDDDLQMRNEVDISLNLHAASIVLAALIKISEDPFLSFPLRDILNPHCWLATLPTPTLDERGVRVPGSDPSASLVNLAISIAKLELNVECISCSSPGLEDIAELLSSPEAVEDATRVANNAMDYVTNLLGGEFLQIQIDRLLSESVTKCPHSAAYSPRASISEYQSIESLESQEEPIDFLIALIVTGACLFFFVALIVLFVKLIVRRRHKHWLQSLSSEQIFHVHKAQVQEQERETEINRRTTAMVCSREIPLVVRLIMPGVILGNIALFLSGHLSLGATVNVEAQLAGEEITIQKFFEFSLAGSTIDMWKAGAKELAILILLFSGVWPYTKQLITLFLWFAPPQKVSASRRGNIFTWLDALAKWSMVDIFVLLISVAAFRISIESPDVAFLPKDFYSIQLMVVPLWGLYANMIAQLVSQVSSHFIIHYHRKIFTRASREYEARRNANGMVTDEDSSSNHSSENEQNTSASSDCHQGNREALCKHPFEKPCTWEGQYLEVRRGVNSGVIITGFALTVLLIIGCTLPSFSLDILGILGVAVESGQNFEEALTKHSVFSIVALIFEEAQFLNTASDYVGLGTLAILLVLCVLIVPLVQTASLLRQWFRPMTSKSRSTNLVLVEILQAWQYVEVYILSIVVAAWQLGGVSEFMINAYCDSLKGTFASLAYYGILDAEDAQCFKVRAQLESAAYVLIAFSVLLALLTMFVTKAAAQQARDETAAIRRSSDMTDEFQKFRTFQNNGHEDDHIERRAKIRPIPAQFTDNFRWLMVPHEASNFRIGATEVGEPEFESDGEFDVGIPVEQPFAFEDLQIAENTAAVGA